MKIVYDPRFEVEYSDEPAAEKGRIQVIYEELKDSYEFVKPEPASEEDLALVHTKAHIQSIKGSGLYEIARLAAGGAIKAAEIGYSGEPAFALIRPPGHHAGVDFYWGFCYFNNIAVSVQKLRREGKVKKVLIVDFDLHYGDGTANIFVNEPQVAYYHLLRRAKSQQLYAFSKYLSTLKDYDIVAVSAGFDAHVEDWGRWLETEDYKEIGGLIKEFAKRVCQGRRYAVLEGGYNQRVLGKNVKAFIEGFKD
ncbi:MAG: histone deacetylase [Candidatus Odinarchaeum yellowstonii]|uniref:Histone deacetylase n=1 Tax=Odinarchaeota yellowstonii (strain LCB_4) TaxID=1841599 RepID=A0AAF0D220_ODILC|nr:MAG: histone deacetylase [Candidatus Odinarchaeum yellowstonii]